MLRKIINSLTGGGRRRPAGGAGRRPAGGRSGGNADLERGAKQVARGLKKRR